MLLTVKQAADAKDVSVARILQLISAGILPAEKFGSVWSINQADLEKLEWNRKPGPKGPRKKTGGFDL